MEINLVKSKYLYDQTYLLLVLPEFIITNSEYDNITILNKELEPIRDLSLPLEDTSIHYSYIKSNKKAILFLPSDNDDSLIHFDVTTFKMVTIKSPQLKFISLSTAYIWNNALCAIVAQNDNTREKSLSVIDTKKSSIKFLPISEGKEKFPLLFNFLQKERQYKNVVRLSRSKNFLVSADYYGDKTLTFINTKTDQSRVVSIKEELDQGKIDQKGCYWASSLPHGIHYQDEWIVLIWEARVVVISPTDKRKTINEIGTFMFAFARIITSSTQSVKFIISLHDKGNEHPTLMQIYEANE